MCVFFLPPFPLLLPLFPGNSAVAAGADGGFGEAHLTDSEGDDSDWGEENEDGDERPVLDEGQQGGEENSEAGDDFDDEPESDDGANDANDANGTDEAGGDQEGEASAIPGEQWNDDDDDERIALAAALAARAGFGATGQGDGNGGASFPGAAFHNNAEPAADYVPPAEDDAYIPGESDEEDDE